MLPGKDNKDTLQTRMLVLTLKSKFTNTKDRKLTQSL